MNGRMAIDLLIHISNKAWRIKLDARTLSGGGERWNDCKEDIEGGLLKGGFRCSRRTGSGELPFDSAGALE